MRNELRTSYESELTFLRQIGAEFADKSPKIASRLLLEPDRCEDPHVERMIESFALLQQRGVHLRIDDDFPQITEALLNILYPHYPCSPHSFHVGRGVHTDPERGKMTSSLLVPKGTRAIFPPPVRDAETFLTLAETALGAQVQSPLPLRPAG